MRRRWSLVLPAAALAIVVMLPLATLLMTAFLMGWRFQPIETGSMAPRYPTGSLAVVLPVDPADVQAGSTIVFADPLDAGRLVAHRALHRLPGDPPMWRTRGDANPVEDPMPVPARSIQGRVAWSIPGLGAIVTTLRGWPAIVLLVIVPLSILVATEIRGWRRPRRR